MINNRRICSNKNCENNSYSKLECSSCRMKKLARYHRRKKKLKLKHAAAKAVKPPKKLKFPNFNIDKGEKNTMSKLKEQDVIDIYASDDSGSSLSKKYGVSRQTIFLIKKGQRWRWLTEVLDEEESEE